MSRTSEAVISALNHMVADFSVFYQKLRGYHWNVTGSGFFQLHELFEEHYTEVADQIDELAERVRQLGGTPPSSYAAQLELASLSEDASVPEAQTMVANIVADYEALHNSLRKLGDLADDEDDSPTENLSEDLADPIEKKLWMLNAFLSQ